MRSHGFRPVGVYDSQELQKHVAEQCGQMEPPVRAAFTHVQIDEKSFVAGEIPSVDVAARPCFRTTRIDPATDKRDDREECPIEAVRELVLSALIHRDYSVHTQAMPIRLTMRKGRLVISSPWWTVWAHFH